MKSVNKCPKFSSIYLSAMGDVEAIHNILNHYNAYISKASLRPFYNEYGGVQMVVDSELKRRIYTDVMKAILKFELQVKTHKNE